MNIIEDLTIVVPTKNEEKNLEACLGSCSMFLNVIVLDSLSTDNTVNVARRFQNVKVIDFDWNGSYPKKRNWILESGYIETEWVLFLDADERLTVEFIHELVRKDLNKYDAFWLFYTNYFRGKELKYGVRMKKLALFRSEFVRYEKADYSSGGLDMEIHEHPVGAQKIGQIRSRILHNDYRGMLNYLKKHMDYAYWESNRFESKSKSDSFISLRERLKYRLLRNRNFGLIYWFYAMVIRLGFLDGRVGNSFYLLKKNYYYNIYLLIKEKN